MKIVLVAGSQRKSSNTLKVAKFLSEKLKGRAEAEILDLGSTPLPMWDPEIKEVELADGRTTEDWKSVLKSAEAFIVMSPEWHGMATPAIKNFFLYFTGSGVLAHKAALLVSVSAGRGGAYPIAELRESSYKNSRICYIPEHLIIRDANNVFNEKTPQSDSDAFYHKQSEFALDTLLAYAEGIGVARKNLKHDFSEFPNGM